LHGGLDLDLGCPDDSHHILRILPAAALATLSPLDQVATHSTKSSGFRARNDPVR